MEGTSEDREPFECGLGGADFACVWEVTDEQMCIVRGMESQVVVKEDLFRLEESWKMPPERRRGLNRLPGRGSYNIG